MIEQPPIGHRHDSLTVIGYGKTSCGKSAIICRCDCGVEKAVQKSNLKNTHSCGCQRPNRSRLANLVHGHSPRGNYTQIYQTWASIKRRCTNPNTKSFKYYGGRGISICPLWANSFSEFFKYVGARPSPKHSIDRFPDNNGNYEPGNVRWATKREQGANTRSNVCVYLNGENTPICVACKNLGFSTSSVYLLMRRDHKSPQDAFDIVRRKRLRLA